MERQCKHGEIYICKRLKLLQYLMEKGFMPDHDMPDITNLKYKWWVFNNSPELEDAIDEYFGK